jgi:esterase/lipase
MNSRTFNIGDLHFINIWKFENFPQNRVVLYFHGNNDNISYRKYVIDICRILELNLILVDYRGYGDSGNYPTSQFLLEDAKTVYKHVSNHYDSSNILIWGESLGGIAAIWTAHKYHCGGLILLSTFANLGISIDKMKSPKPIKSLLKSMAKSKLMDNGKWIKSVVAPTVIIHSPDDDILPYANAELLYNSVGCVEKKLINIRGPHSQPYFTDDNLIDLLNFIHIDTRIVSDTHKISHIRNIINNI